MQKPKKPFPWRFATVVFVAVVLIISALFYRPDPILWSAYRFRAVLAGFTPAAADLYAARALVQFHNRAAEVESTGKFLEHFPNGSRVPRRERHRLPAVKGKIPGRPVAAS